MDTILPSGGAAAPAVTDRTQLALTAQGVITETWDRKLDRVSQIFVDGAVYFMCVGLRSGDTVTNLSLMITTAGTATTLSKVGLYSKTGTRLGLSADQGSAWNSTGMKTIALITPYAVPSDDGYYVAVVSKASTTLPTALCMNNIANSIAAVGSGMTPMATQLGQTDLPSPATIGLSGTPCAFWMAVS